MQKRTLIERLTLIAGGGVVVSLLALLWKLVSGAALSDPLPKALVACVFAGMLAVLLLVTFGQQKGKGGLAGRPAAA